MRVRRRRGLRRLTEVAKVESPSTPRTRPDLQDQHSVLIPVEIRGPPTRRRPRSIPSSPPSTRLRRRTRGSTSGRSATALRRRSKAPSCDDLKKAGLYSIPADPDHPHRRLRRARRSGHPAPAGRSRPFSRRSGWSLSQIADPDGRGHATIILLIGLAVGVDYTMFYLKREREERAAGRSEEAALEAAAATSGRSVLISGCTVLVAMSGMFLTGTPGCRVVCRRAR